MFKCEICKKEFKDKHALGIHLINIHEQWNLYDNDISSSFGCADQQARIKVVVNNCIGTVLSVGGGDGNIENEIKKAGHSVYFTDINQKRVDKVRNTYSITGRVANAKDLSCFADRSFDTVIACEVLEHIKDMGIALQEIMKKARKRVIITYPISDYWDVDETHLWKIRTTAINRNGKIKELHQNENKASFIVIVMERVNGNI